MKQSIVYVYTSDLVGRLSMKRGVFYQSFLAVCASIGIRMSTYICSGNKQMLTVIKQQTEQQFTSAIMAFMAIYSEIQHLSKV